MTRPAFGGHLMATIVCPRFEPAMATVKTGCNAEETIRRSWSCKCEDYASDLSLAADAETEVLGIVKAARKW